MADVAENSKPKIKAQGDTNETEDGRGNQENEKAGTEVSVGV